jgi:GcrA cell cycle regulator
MQWTAEAVEDLKRLALEGRSASVIAAALGAASRNAVIGKASRIGIKLNGGGGASARGAAVRAHQAHWASASYTRHRAGNPKSAALAHDPGVKPAERSKAAWVFSQAEVGEMQRVKFEEIRESACRWPLGDPTSGEFAYCGLTPAKGQSYCAGHCRMAYRPPNARASRSPAERQGLRALGNPWRLF